jgi:hypothetical protein
MLGAFYEDGKVCLSILGTWAGPGWTPVMNIRLVLDSIRSLMGAFPVQNEPSYETMKPDNIISMGLFQVIQKDYDDFIDKLNNFISKDTTFKTYFLKEMHLNYQLLDFK